MVSPLLHVGLLRQGGRGRWHQGRTEAVKGKRKGREGGGHRGCLYRRKLNIQRQDLITHMWSIRPLNQACEYQNDRVSTRSSHPRSPIDYPSNGSKSQIFCQLRSLFLFFFGVTLLQGNPLFLLCVSVCGFPKEKIIYKLCLWKWSNVVFKNPTII
jgi:hypothetical protein